MSWKENLAQVREASKMEVEPTTLDQLGGGWGMITSGISWLSFMRRDGAFFEIIGLMIHAAGREVAGWGQPMMVERASGIYILVTNEDYSCFLVSFRKEPGNPSEKRHVLLGPSLQASKSNYERAHKGKSPPRAEFYGDDRVIWIDAPKDGGRFITSQNNCNRMGILVLPDGEFEALVLEDGEMVMTRSQLKEAVLGGEFNAYLREVVGAAILLAS